ncbi:MAG: hypothetical protein HYX25_03435 [Candidatus Solibacter usitatus]|nr:hypothetical protein [Candidatus Solibacter usitatus]
MRTRLIALLVLALAAWAANQKLYMTDGSYQLVREYKVEGDRVRFYSMERSEWEEMPKELVDLTRTEKEFQERQTQFEKEARIFAQEEKAAREMEKEVMRVPQNPGVYWIEGEQAKSLKAAESSVRTNRGRSVLGRLSPIPMVSGKATVEIANAHSLNIFTNPEQEFYIQLAQTERFAIVRLMSKAAVRIVEEVTIVPISKETVEERDTVEIFQKQMTPDGLYKIWPKQPMTPGEYAVVEFSEGKLNLQVWDFAVKAAK